MSQPIEIRATDTTLHKLKFKQYRYRQERQAVQFLPRNGESNTLSILTPWGAELIADAGDYIVNEIGTPDNRWPVKKEIFEETYIETRPGIYIKRALVSLYPLSDFTKDPEQLVSVHTLEGVVTVRAGDFYLCRGVRGEIWPMPIDKVHTTLAPA
ncbi:MAG TPA: hypothetical protein PK530_05100 [Anaerolineales bacterium]|nr:hypothetical protein [Anaerolineales bacterium]